MKFPQQQENIMLGMKDYLAASLVLNPNKRIFDKTYFDVKRLS